MLGDERQSGSYGTEACLRWSRLAEYILQELRVVFVTTDDT